MHWVKGGLSVRNLHVIIIWPPTIDGSPCQSKSSFPLSAELGTDALSLDRFIICWLLVSVELFTSVSALFIFTFNTEDQLRCSSQIYCGPVAYCVASSWLSTFWAQLNLTAQCSVFCVLAPYRSLGASFSDCFRCFRVLPSPWNKDGRHDRHMEKQTI